MWRWCLRTVQNAGGYAVDIATSPRLYLFATSSFWIRLYGTNSKSPQTYDGPLLSVYNGARRGPLNQAMEMETQRAWQETSYRPAMRTRAVSEHPGALTHLLTDRTLRYGGGRRPEPHGVTPAPSSEERSHNDVLDAGRRAGPSSNASSADRLRELLFHANHTVKSDEPFGINRIRNLYLSANARGQLPSFKPGDFQALVCLVGSLSVSTSRRPYVSVYSHPLVTRMSAHSLRPHWGLLRRILKDKSSLGYRLNVSDHYWLMRAHIAELQTADSGKWAHLHPDVHVHYLEALLVNGNEEFIEMAICKACDLLLWYHDCPPQLLAVFWKVLLRTDQDIRPEMKRDILQPRHFVHRAVGVLIRARRMRAAKRMYERLRDAQSESSRTAIGNHILYSSLLAKSRRNARRVRKGLDTLNQLTNKFGFVPDRVTVNVLLVGLMRWTSVVDREKLRVLFDHMVRSGYPTGGLHFRSVVPFGTAAPTTQMLNIPEVHSSLSYAKHVRPLYKMFIKAFHRRGDKVAVGVVIKILKAVEAEAVDQSEQRGLARAEGIRRKSARNSRR
ncbi:hypothetical protein IEO21_05537 [Rhodonia placenta]|uniref:Pentatricopeptide repeat protein n=1 Tax=Rhodonia placenta TaxID=104341 RepID=A0A8H7P1Y7_9APHY|nr:hypothetical protein IEO21_05537 [Postia placenta]